MKDIVMDDDCISGGEEEGVEYQDVIVNEEVACVSTQTDVTNTRTCGTQTEQCDYMFRTQKPWIHGSI